MKRVLAVATVVSCAAALAPPAVSSASALGGALDWRRYVLGPATTDVRPVRVASVSGNVVGASSLLHGGRATLTFKAGGPAPVIVLDYGKDVGGLPRFGVSRVSGRPTLHVSYSEAGQYANDPLGDMEQRPSFLPLRPGQDPNRYDEYAVAAPGAINATLLQGAERFQHVTLTKPGSVTLSRVGIRFGSYDATPDKYQGWFLSSDDTLNKIWYAGAYTAQLDMAPAHTTDGGPQPVIYDGAKRDRLTFTGDLAQSIPVVADSLGRGGASYLKQSLAILGAAQAPDGSVPGYADPSGKGTFYSATYSMYFVPDLASYYQYTADRAFVAKEWPVVRRELAWNAAHVSGGLLRTTEADGFDWDPYDGRRTGAVTAYNALYYHALVEAASLASSLGLPGDSARYLARASALRAAINAHLWNPALGAYDVSDVKRGGLAQDTNVAAVLYGVAPAQRVPGILSALKKLWIPRGSLPFSADLGYSNWVSPFIGGFDLQARFAAGNTSDALTLMRNEWGQMVAPGPQGVGTLWENILPSGAVPSGVTSLAHAWSAGPTSALSESVLGARPVTPGYRTWLVQPHPGDLRWAEGQVPTPYGPLSVSWWHTGARLHIVVTAPPGTSGAIQLPGHAPVPAKPGTTVITP